METWQSQQTNKFLSYLRLITVEPTMILYMMAFMTTSVVEQAFFVDKACRINKNFTDEICANISAKENKEYAKQVHITVSNFQFMNDIAGHALQIILAFFMGAWSDKRGRKIPLLMGLFGKLYYSTMIVVNSLNRWPVETIIWTATLPMAFTGADVAIFAAAFTYLVDVSTPENRTIRLTFLEVCYLATMPTGVALGSYLFRSVTNRSFTVMFLINMSLLVVSIVYSLIRLKWRTTDKQKPLMEASNLFTDFFNYSHLTDTAATLFKKRPFNRRRCLIILILTMALYTFQRDENEKSYLYTQLAFNWSFKSFSNFKTYRSAIQDIFLLLGIPLMSKLLNWRDTVIIMIGALAHSIARIFYILANDDVLFYIGGLFAAIGPIVAPVIRSMVSKMITASEKGKALSVLSAADNAIPLFAGVSYSQIYNATVHTRPNTFYYLTIATQMGVFLLILFVHLTTKDEELIHKEEDDSRTGKIEDIEEILT